MAAVLAIGAAQDQRSELPMWVVLRPWPRRAAMTRMRRERPFTAPLSNCWGRPKRKFDLSPLGARTRSLTRPHSITSSARARIAGGNTSLSAVAVFKLTANLKWVGCSIGSSPGEVPRKMRTT
jgi:hypothetical protein